MSQKEKRQAILELLATGKITAQEAADLLSAPEETPAEPAAAAAPPPQPAKAPKAPDATNGETPKWFHIRVSDMETGKNKVMVNIPLRLMKFGFNIGRRFAPELSEMDWQDVDQLMTAEKGLIVDVQDVEDGEHVQIYVD